LFCFVNERPARRKRKYCRLDGDEHLRVAARILVTVSLSNAPQHVRQHSEPTKKKEKKLHTTVVL
jgi:hypothetical protein